MANERWRTDGKYPNAADPRVRDGVTTILLIRGYFVRPLIPPVPLFRPLISVGDHLIGRF